MGGDSRPPRDLPLGVELSGHHLSGIRGASRHDGEGGLGEDPGFERGVVGGDELDLDQVLAGSEVREPFGRAPALQAV
jgi:hypothetical protein